MTATRLNVTTETVSGWEVTRHPDGTVEVAKRVTSTLTYASWAGVWWATACASQAYPLAFASAPAVECRVVEVTGGDVMALGWRYTVSGAALKTASPVVMAMRPNSIAGATLTVELRARGVPA